ncbi:heavy-metal-associated domain-containing protein [Thiohalobacter thiocyanaticus]|uniref:Copper chaperone n=1 Tax=Thiohalobacter thiocyanaticus TaxID=585455 RepID=A0A426QHI5_9GAMM|nr:heavy-metal-associated domain-containing protein [Thiohalobacter thiocyanaticus]RRQ21225.1 copper chaperone [Thiohalobacter thiocyanaticus]
MEIEFSVTNVKCNGCVKTIEDGLHTEPGVESVKAGLDGSVKVSGNDLDRAALAARLSELGYPEA